MTEHYSYTKTSHAFTIRRVRIILLLHGGDKPSSSLHSNFVCFAKMIPIFHQFLNPSEAQFSLNYYTNTNTQDHI